MIAVLILIVCLNQVSAAVFEWAGNLGLDQAVNKKYVIAIQARDWVVNKDDQLFALCADVLKRRYEVAKCNKAAFTLTEVVRS